MEPADSITLVPYMHGKLAFAQHIREMCLKTSFDCIAVDLPSCLQEHLLAAVQDLPHISAVFAQGASDTVFFAPADPCDAAIEAIRQSQQNHVPCFCVGGPVLFAPRPLPILPDQHALSHLGFDAYLSLCLRIVNETSRVEENASPSALSETRDVSCRYAAHELLSLASRFKRILALVHLGNFPRTARCLRQERTFNFSFDTPPAYSIRREFVNPEHLYFALGELPFVTGKFEAERYDPFSERVNIPDCIKSLFTEARDNYGNKQDAIPLSTGRIQRGLTFLRNLTVRESRFLPDLPDIVTAAKGVGGNSYALRVLESARYFPFLPFELGVPLASIGIDAAQLPGQHSPQPAVNLFRDVTLVWRRLSLKHDPSRLSRRKYRFLWNGSSACSHVPEDERVERFNAHVRTKARRILSEDRATSEKFTVSVKDGIDIRETMRNWFTSDIYVREVPPSRGAVDTVVIIFDADHDERYPHCATWYAEHGEESTLSFYATNPFADMIGPGIARAYYGGLSLLFPPRMVPDAFSLPGLNELPTLAERLTRGALLFSQESTIAYVAAKKPGVRLARLASSYKKPLTWIPLSTFSEETLQRLRKFHVLNGKTVRSWAARFIGDLS
jgi:hypothetical protein